MKDFYKNIHCSKLNIIKGYIIIRDHLKTCQIHPNIKRILIYVMNLIIILILYY